ncbi:MAG: hypothetical protein L0387_19605 [Acidobacteria bacterium]|nr:hypothetical protein [Acidobacteriota bacterium]MCI0721828.1 hypothetical protein [Acidobacteriota bacterium]
MREAHVLLRFPEQQYLRDGMFVDLAGAGRGSNMVVAINRAIRNALRSSTRMRYKVPKQIYISVGLDDLAPIPFWHFNLQKEVEKARP